MTATSAVTRGARVAAARMLDEFSIRVPLGRTYDPATGTESESWQELFTTAGRVKVSGGLGVAQAEAGGRTVVTVSRELHIPITSPEVPAGAVAVCTGVHPSSDPTLLGAELRLTGPAPGSQTTARRLQVTEVVA